MNQQKQQAIICETRFDSMFKHFNDSEIKQLVKLRVENMYNKYKQQQNMILNP